MPNQEDIYNYNQRLKSYRRTLAHYLEQMAAVGKQHVEPNVTNGIRDARDNIRRIKDILRTWGQTVEDRPDDEEASEDAPTLPRPQHNPPEPERGTIHDIAMPDDLVDEQVNATRVVDRPQEFRFEAPAVSSDIRVDRQDQLAMFQGILEGTSEFRGMVIYGENSWGKSTLLRMLQDRCQALGTECFPFDLNYCNTGWQYILDSAVEMLGENLFPRYMNAQVKASGKEFESRAGHVELHRTDLTNPMYYAMHRLTKIFLEEFQAFPHRIVWFIDAVDKVDPITRAWLIWLFGQIASQKLTKLILIVAGRIMFYYDLAWNGKIKEQKISGFDKAAVLELFRCMGITREWEQLENIAETWIEKTGGNPLHIRMLLESEAPRWRA